MGVLKHDNVILWGCGPLTKTNAGKKKKMK